MRTVWIFCCLAGMLPAWLTAQDLKADLDQVMTVFSGSEHFSARVRVEVTGLDAGSTLARIQKSGDQFLYEVDGTLTLVHTSGVLIANRAEQKLFLLPRSAMQPQDTLLPGWQFPGTEDLAYEYLGTSEAGKHYRMEFSGQAIASADLWLDPETGFFRCLEYRYPDQAGVATVCYEAVETSARFPKKNFDPGRFVIRKKGKWIGVKEYEGYEVIDNWTVRTTEDR